MAPLVVTPHSATRRSARYHKRCPEPSPQYCADLRAALEMKALLRRFAGIMHTRISSALNAKTKAKQGWELSGDGRQNSESWRTILCDSLRCRGLPSISCGRHISLKQI